MMKLRLTPWRLPDHFVTPQVRAGIGDKFPVIYGVGYKRDGEGRIVVNEKGIPEAGET